MDHNLQELLMPIGVLGTFGLATVAFVKTLTSYFLRKRMIEKGYVNSDAQAIFQVHSDENKYSSLKWGLIIFFGSISLILMEFIPVDPESPLPYGLFAFFISLGFLLYFYLVNKLSAKGKL